MKHSKLITIISVLVGFILCVFIAYYFYVQNSELTKDDITNLESNYGLTGFEGEDVKIVGEYNGKTVVARFFCSDLCREREADNTFIVYENVEESECLDIGGSIVEVYGWGRFYVGCSPLSS